MYGLFTFLLGALVAASFFDIVVPLEPAELLYTQIILVADFLLILLAAPAIHLYLLPTTYRFGTHDDKVRQNILVEWQNYPVRFVFLFYLSIYALIAFSVAAVLIPFVYYSLPVWEIWIRYMGWITMMALPHAVISFFTAEKSRESLLELLKGWHDDARIMRVGVRTKIFLTAFFWFGMIFLWNYFLPAWAMLVGLIYGAIVITLCVRSIVDPWEKARDLWRNKEYEGFHEITNDYGVFILTTLRYRAEQGEVYDTRRNLVEALNTDSNKIIKSVDRHQEFAEQHQASLRQINVTLSDLTKLVHQLSENANYIKNFSERGMDDVENARTNLSETLQNMGDIYREASAGAQRLLDLSLQMTQIEEVIKIIQDIADQTKIIGFNAAIETSGAGEIGQRFGVVAKEIRTLAQNIADSTSRVTHILLDVRNASQHSVLAGERELKLVQEGLHHGGHARTAFESAYWSAKQTLETIQQINDAITQQKSAIEQLNGRVVSLGQSSLDGIAQEQQIIADVKSMHQRLQS